MTNSSSPSDASNGRPVTEQADAQLWRYVEAPVDEVMLLRYFARQADLGPLFDTDLTIEEVRQVVAGLNFSEEWQEAWATLEEQFSLSVSYPMYEQPPVRPSPLRLMPRFYGVAAAVIGFGMLIAFTIARSQTKPPQVEWAVLQDDLRPSQARSLADTNYFAAGVEALYAAQPKRISFNAGFDEAQVEEGRRYLHQAFEQTASPFERASIAFFLSKAYLMQNDVDAAKAWIVTATRQGIPWQESYYGPELERLRQRYAPDA